MDVSHAQSTHPDQAVVSYRDNAVLHELLFIRFLGAGIAIRAFLRQAELLAPGKKVLDAGCGSGLITKPLFQQAKRRAIPGVTFDCFDRHKELLDRFRQWARKSGNDSIAIRETGSLDSTTLPDEWRDYDLIFLNAFLDDVGEESFASTLKAYRQRLSDQGRLFLIVTRKTGLTKQVSMRWWQSKLFTPEEVLDGLAEAGFASAQFHAFPGTTRPYTQWILIAEALQKA